MGPGTGGTWIITTMGFFDGTSNVILCVENRYRQLRILEGCVVRQAEAFLEELGLHVHVGEACSPLLHHVPHKIV